MPGPLVLSGAIGLGHTMPERSFRALLDELEQGNGSCGAWAADICAGSLATGALARIGLDIAVGCHEEARH